MVLRFILTFFYLDAGIACWLISGYVEILPLAIHEFPATRKKPD